MQSFYSVGIMFQLSGMNNLYILPAPQSVFKEMEMLTNLTWSLEVEYMY